MNFCTDDIVQTIFDSSFAHDLRKLRAMKIYSYKYLALACLLATLTACGRSEQANVPPAQRPAGASVGRPASPPVQVFRAPLSVQNWVDEIAALGTTSANESITLSAKVTETVARVNFSDNATVNAGDVLVELTGKAEVAALKEAQAAFVDADRQYDRLSTVVKQGTVTRAQLDTQGATRDQARARSEAIRARLSDRVIVAPFSGVTGFRMVSPGALVTPGTAITTLDDIASLKLDFSIPENQLSRVHVGDLILARSSAFAEREFSGEVVSLDSRIDPNSRAVKVRAKIANPKHENGPKSENGPKDENGSYILLPGMLLTVKLQAQTRSALAIAEIAVLQQADQSYVYKMTANNTVERVDVVLGARRSGQVEVLSGLTAADVVIGEGGSKLRPGMTVELLDAATAAPVSAPAVAATPQAVK